MTSCPWGHPAALLGWLSPGDSRKVRAHRRAVGREGSGNTTLHCTFRVSLLGRDMEHPPPLAWVGTSSPKQSFPKPPDLSHTNLHIPSDEKHELGVVVALTNTWTKVGEVASA